MENCFRDFSTLPPTGPGSFPESRPSEPRAKTIFRRGQRVLTAPNGEGGKLSREVAAPHLPQIPLPTDCNTALRPSRGTSYLGVWF